MVLHLAYVMESSLKHLCLPYINTNGLDQTFLQIVAVFHLFLEDLSLMVGRGLMLFYLIYLPFVKFQFILDDVINYDVASSVTRLGDFESSVQLSCLQKLPKNIVDFWAILKNIF